jgi:hypothetical protein
MHCLLRYVGRLATRFRTCQKACLYHSDRVAESCCHEIILFRRNVAAANGARQSLPSVFRLNTSVRLVDFGRTVFEESYPELAASSRPSVQLALHLRRIAVALLRHGGLFVPQAVRLWPPEWKVLTSRCWISISNRTHTVGRHAIAANREASSKARCRCRRAKRANVASTQ